MLHVLRTIDGWDTMSAEELRDRLLARVWIPNSTAYTVAALIAEPGIGKEGARVVLGTLQAARDVDPLAESIIIGLSTTGLELYQAERQEMLGTLAALGKWPDALRDRLLELGGTWSSLWATAGGSGDVPSARDIHVAQRKHLLYRQSEAMRENDTAAAQESHVRRVEAIDAWDGDGNEPRV